MKKLVYILWPNRELSPVQRREILLGKVATELLARGATYLQVNVADDRVEAKSPAPELPFADEPFVAQVNVWAEDGADRHAFEDVLRGAGFDVAGYLVDEHLYTEYGENAHAAPRSWPDGERSPGITAVTLLERPEGMSKDEWMRRWFGRQSPMSEQMQPRSRYVRNVVLEVVTPGAFPYEGIVEEAWPSAKHIADPKLFYGASNAFELARNMTTMLRSVVSFLPIWKIPNVMTTEYFVRTPFGVVPGSRASSPADLRNTQ